MDSQLSFTEQLEDYDLYDIIYMPLTGKFPILKEWTKLNESKTPESGQNVGIVTGKTSKITVIDIDIQDLGLETWNKLIEKHGEPQTAKVQTGSGGYHYYFEYNTKIKTGSKRITMNRKKIGIDVKNNGGQVVAPPSIHPVTKNTYKWCTGLDEMSKVPTWLEGLLTGKYELDTNYNSVPTGNVVQETIGNIMNNFQITANNDISIGDITQELIDSLIASIPNTEFYKREANMVILKTVGRRKCIIGGECNLSDNCYLILKNDGIYFGCHDADCQGKLKQLHQQQLLDEDIIQMLDSFNYKEHSSDEKEDVLTKTRKAILQSDFTDHTLATYFVQRESWKDKLIFYDEQLFHFTTYWKRIDDAVLYNNLSTDLFLELKQELDRTLDITKDIKGYSITLKKFNKLQNMSGKSGIVSTIKHIVKKSTHEGYPFDKNVDYLGFKNGMIDLTTGTFREQKPEDMISLVAPYDWDEPEQARLDEVNEMLNKILPEKGIRKCFLTTLSTCLDGRVLDKIVILTGVGRNGKDTLATKLLSRVLGDDLYYFQNSAVITEKIKSGPNQAVSDMRNKRAVVISEPAKNQPIQCATLKMITGGDRINARGLNSKDTKTTLNLTMMILANDIPPLDVIDDAIFSRLMIFPFRSLFKDPDEIAEYPADTSHLYLKNKKYISNSWLNKHRVAFMSILLDHYKHYRNAEYIIPSIPKEIIRMKKEYITETSELSNWFFSEYKISDDETKFVKMKNVFDLYKQSAMYENMTKKDKRTFNRTKLIHVIKTHPTLRGFYCERKKIENKNCRSILLKIEKIDIAGDDSDDSGDEADHEHLLNMLRGDNH